MEVKLYVDLKFELLQQVRLVHALSESPFAIVVRSSEVEKFQPLKEKFGMEITGENAGDFDLSGFLTVNHVEPITSINSLRRPLIFPHAITEYCHSLWSTKRKYRFSFMGLITRKRQELLEGWVRTNLGRQIGILSEPTGLAHRLKRKLFGTHYSSAKRIGDLLLWSSHRGRVFPIKSWDDAYFRLLSKSKFVLCPSGDCIWSYRFFESILCGAIPIVEQDCRAYEGFRFFTFNDKATELNWSEEDAEHNYRLCIERITVPNDLLDQELRAIVHGKKRT